MRTEMSQLFVGGQEPRSQKRSDLYKLLVSKYGPMKMFEVPISDVLTSEEMENVAYEEKSTQVQEPLSRKLEAMEKKATICLHCLRSSDPATPCRFQHMSQVVIPRPRKKF